MIVFIVYKESKLSRGAYVIELVATNPRFCLVNDMQMLTDEEMIRAYLSSQPTHCFETLYKRYVNKVYRRCLSLTQDTAKAEDFTHDIFLRAFSKLDAFQERARFSTWLYSITYNYCLDQLKLAKRISIVTIAEATDFEIPESNESLIHEEAIQLMERAIDYLSPKDIRLLQLRYEEGLSINEIADLYKSKVSAIKMRLKRSRDRIAYLYKTLQYHQTKRL